MTEKSSKSILVDFMPIKKENIIMNYSIVSIIIFTLILLFGLDALVFAQKFTISQYPTDNISVDRIGDKVYMWRTMENKTYEYNIKTGIEKISRFKDVPIFSNKKHIAVYYDNATLFYDFEKDSTYSIPDVVYDRHFLSFSPNDSGIVTKEKDRLTYYSFTKKKKYTTDIYLTTPWPPNSWSSDTTLLTLNLDKTGINELNCITGVQKTIFTVNSGTIYWFNHSVGSEFISYSLLLEKDNNPKIHRYYIKAQKDSIIFDISKDVPQCNVPFFLSFVCMKWSPDNKKFSFISYFYTISASQSFCFYSESNKTKMFGDCYSALFTDTYEWLNNDTIIYIDKGVYGYNLNNNTSAVLEDITIPSKLKLSNYPNPFNSSTIISFTLTRNSHVIIKIYDVLGREVKEIANDYYTEGYHSINFKENNLSSGMYLLRLITNENVITKKMILQK